MVKELQEIVNEVTDAELNSLLSSFFADKDFLKSYARAPAAKNVHHNWIGGLLQHSLEVAAFCRKTCDIYCRMDRSLLLTGALLHDIGKLEEYDQGSLSFEFTTRGKLMGHIVLGVEMIRGKIAEIPNFSSDSAMHLLHMIISHHGTQEWGSPEVPKTFEAFTLFHADLISSRLNQFYKLQERAGGEDWSEYDRLLERSIYVPTRTD